MKFQTFEEFWPFYVSEHRNRLSRLLHVSGTLVAVLWTLLTAFFAPRLVPLSLVFGYGPAWIGHYAIEKNRPATFKHPLWSLRGDFRMCFRVLAGRRLI